MFKVFWGLGFLNRTQIGVNDPKHLRWRVIGSVFWPFFFLSLSLFEQTLSIIGSIDYRITLPCKPLVSVTQFWLRLVNLHDEARIFHGLRQMLPNVDDLGLTLITADSHASVLTHACLNFPRLRRLSIFDNASVMRSLTDTLFDNLRNLDRLEELQLQSVHVEVEFMQPNEHLKRLEFRSHYLFDEELIMLADLYPNLKYLGMSWCKNVTNNGIKEFRSRLPGCVVRFEHVSGYFDPLFVEHNS